MNATTIAPVVVSRSVAASFDTEGLHVGARVELFGSCANVGTVESLNGASTVTYRMSDGTSHSYVKQSFTLRSDSGSLVRLTDAGRGAWRIVANRQPDLVHALYARALD